MVETQVAMDVGFNIGIRKNEAILGGIVRQAVFLVHFEQLGGVEELVTFAVVALVLDLAELSERPFELAGEALAVDADVGESDGVLAEGEGHGEGGFGLRMVSADAILHFGDAEREEVGLNGGGAIEAPGGIDEGLDELGFGGAAGLVFVQKGLGVALVSGMVLGGQDDGLARQAVAKRVEFGALLTGFGSGAGGMLCVSAIDGGTIGGAVGAVGAEVGIWNVGIGHFVDPFNSGISCGCSGPTRGCGEVVG